MLFDISNNTMISTLDSEFMISDIKKINSLLFAVREKLKLSLITVIDKNSLVRTEIL